MKQKKKGKLLTKFETTPAQVIKIRGSAVTMMRNGKELETQVNSRESTNQKQDKNTNIKNTVMKK